MIRPSLELAVAFNEAVREPDEWFDEPDDLGRFRGALDSMGSIDDPVEAAIALASRVPRAQAFGEGNKRTALLLARWVLDQNGIDGAAVLPADDRQVADLLVRAAAGAEVEKDRLALFRTRT